MKYMSCRYCENNIKIAVAKLEGIKNVEVDLIKKKVNVEVDLEKINIKQIKDTIQDQGYDVID